MKKLASILLLGLILSACQSTTMNITSTAFTEQQSIPAKYTCQGENVNPPLHFEGTPEAAQSLALIVDDPDAPAGTWTHWTLWNIPATISDIPDNWVIPDEIIEGMTSFGEETYGGPCPPSGVHRYRFKLYALDTTLELPSTSNVQELEDAMQGHVLDSATLTGTYQKQ